MTLTYDYYSWRPFSTDFRIMKYQKCDIFVVTFQIRTAKTEEDAATYQRQSINYLDRYMYLILFNTYLHMERVDHWDKPFTQWTEEVST